MAAPSEDDSSAVVQTLKDDGSWDDIRQQIVNQLKQHAVLRDAVTQTVAQSNVLNSLAVATMDKRRLLEDLNASPETMETVREHILKAIWELAGSGTHIGRTMDERVHQALCSVYEKRAEREHPKQLAPQQVAQRSSTPRS